MSGGVDSSVAAALLQRQGYEVLGAFMRLGSPDGVDSSDDASDEACETPLAGKSHKQGCCSVSDAADARRVAGVLGIPLYVLNFQKDFGRVIDYFVDEYNRGRTPNPCVRCNDWLKFGRLAQYAEAVGADYVASGHYARIGLDPDGGRPALMRAVDPLKDQSYVLFGMNPKAVSHTLLPIGDLPKWRVRELALEFGLPVHNKPDSQEICFVPGNDYAALVKRRTPDRVTAGEVVDTAGEVVGGHGGHQHFTVGQRRGVGVALGYPIYVIDIEPASNRVVVGPKERLMKSSLLARQINVFGPYLDLNAPLKCHVKVRYNQPPQPATAVRVGDDELHVTFDEPQAAVTPGQAVVCYVGDVVAGGGWIESAAV